MYKKIDKYIKLGLLVLLSCSVSLTAEAASKEEGGGKSWFKGLFGLGSQPVVEENESLQKQLEALRVKVTADEEQLRKTQQELETVKAEEERFRQGKEEAERAALAAEEANTSLQTRLADQQREIQRLQKIEVEAKAEHDKHVKADELATARLAEVKRLREEKAQVAAEITAKEIEIKEKLAEASRKTKAENKAKVLALVEPLREQLAKAQAESARLTTAHEEALKQEAEKQAEKAQAEYKAKEAEIAREIAEKEHQRIEAEQRAKKLEQQLAKEKLKADTLAHENAVQTRKLLEAQHIAEKNTDLATTQIAALKEQLKETKQEVANEHALHHKTAEQLEKAKKEHFKEAVRKHTQDNLKAQKDLLDFVDNATTFFNGAQPVSYQTFKENIKAGEDYGPAFDLAISHIMLHRKTADIKDGWTSTIHSLPTPPNYRGENTALKLVATLHETLKQQPKPDLIIDTYFTISDNVLANGGCFGINFKRSATEDELSVVIPALRLTGTRAISNTTNLAEALEVILSAYWHIEYSAAPLQQGEDVIFESHRRNITLAAAQVLKKAYAEDEILDGLETKGVVTASDRAYAGHMWTYYNQFADEKLG